MASALGFFVQTFAQRHAPPARTALILASEPAFAGLFGWLLGDEHLSAVAWLGAVLILAAIVAVEVVPRFGRRGRSRRGSRAAVLAGPAPRAVLAGRALLADLLYQDSDFF